MNINLFIHGGVRLLSGFLPLKTFRRQLLWEKLNTRNILHNVHQPIPILVAQVWQRNLDYVKILLTKISRSTVAHFISIHVDSHLGYIPKSACECQKILYSTCSLSVSNVGLPYLSVWAMAAIKPVVQLLQIHKVHLVAHSSACNFCRF